MSHVLESYTGRAARVFATIPLMLLLLFFRSDAVSNELYRDVDLIAFLNGAGVLLIAFNALNLINLLYLLQSTKPNDL